jgi:hypothetical protein
MQPRVTAVLVARNGAQYLTRTLAAIAAQTRRLDSLVYVDADSTDKSADLLSAAVPTQFVTSSRRKSFAGAVAHAVRVAVPQTVDNEWLWLLSHDNAPEPGALAALLAAVEVAPSVAIAGPKLMRWDEPNIIASFGETLTRFGRSLTVVHDELDQAQHDMQSDFLGVAAGGMLVRRQVWTQLGGFDPALGGVDAALDLSVRARLVGHRVIGVPSARVASAGPIELFGRRTLSSGSQNQLHRLAELHRRLVYAPALAVPLHWLSLLPIALGRSLSHILAKQPDLVGGELSAAIAGAFDAGVPGARAHLRRTRTLDWVGIGDLRMRWAEVRERRAQERASVANLATPVRVGPGFFAGGGAWTVLIAALAGFVAFGHFMDGRAIAGGGLTPLSATVGQLWSHTGYAWRDVGSGFIGAADPFSYVLALMGSATFWAPSLSVIVLYLAALPLAALSAWWCAARFSIRPWAPAVAATAWVAAPPFLAALGGGHLGAVIAHILLPALVLLAVNASRSWSMSAIAALVFAIVTAAAPLLVPALLLMWLAWMLAQPKSIHRLVGIPIPALALFAPLVVQQISRGNWLAWLAEPGVPVLGSGLTGWQLALGSTDPSMSGWSPVLQAMGIAGGLTPVIVMVLIAPFVALAVLALFLPGSRRSIPAMLIALLGFVTAVVGTHIEVTVVGSSSTGIWPGPALSLYWLGLAGAAIVAIEALGRVAALPAFLAGLGSVLVAIPLFTAATTGAVAVAESNGRLLPAFVSAEAANREQIGTLELAPQPDGGVAATVHRGQGTTLDEQSTLASTDTEFTRADARLATLAGNISSRSGFDVAAELDALQIAFVLVPETTSSSATTARHRVIDALDGNQNLTPIGNTDTGSLWHYSGLAAGEAPSGPSATQTPLGLGILIAQGTVFGLTLLLAVPTTRRKRVRATDGESAKAGSTAGGVDG